MVRVQQPLHPTPPLPLHTHQQSKQNGLSGPNTLQYMIFQPHKPPQRERLRTPSQPLGGGANRSRWLPSHDRSPPPSGADTVLVTCLRKVTRRSLSTRGVLPTLWLLGRPSVQSVQMYPALSAGLFGVLVGRERERLICDKHVVGT